MDKKTKLAIMTGALSCFMLHDITAREPFHGGKSMKGNDTNQARQNRKERARQLTAQRMAETQAQGDNRKKKHKRK